MQQAIILNAPPLSANTKQYLTASTFIEWLKQIDACKQTIETYTKEIKQFMFYLIHNRIEQPSRQDIINYRDYLAHALNDADGKPNSTHIRFSGNIDNYKTEEISTPLKTTTINNYLMAIKQFFNYCYDLRLYDNIAKRIKPLKTTRQHKKDAISLNLASDILHEIDTTTESGLRDYAIIYLARTTGLRVNEIATLRICDIKTIDNKIILSILRKGYTERQNKAIAQETANIIKEYLKTRASAKDNEPLFISYSNRNAVYNKLTPQSISRIFKTYLRKNGITDNSKSFHSLRHGYATDLFNNNVDLHTISQELGHANINTTEIYINDLNGLNNSYSEIVATQLKNTLERN